MDGQLARRVSKPSPLGKYVDGVGDLIMMISLTIGFVSAAHFAWGRIWFWICFAACICLQQHFIFFDKVSFTYTIQTKDAKAVEKTLNECDYELVVQQRDKAFKERDWFPALIWAFACLYAHSLSISRTQAADMKKAAKAVSVSLRNEALAKLEFLGMGTSMMFWYLSLMTGSTSVLLTFVFSQLSVSMVYHFYVLGLCQKANLYLGPYTDHKSVLPYVLVAATVDCCLTYL
jgi:phosphatidylglycerophosphate synthase